MTITVVAKREDAGAILDHLFLDAVVETAETVVKALKVEDGGRIALKTMIMNENG